MPERHRSIPRYYSNNPGINTMVIIARYRPPERDIQVIRNLRNKREEDPNDPKSIFKIVPRKNQNDDNSIIKVGKRTK